jgi:hypothetical protein
VCSTAGQTKGNESEMHTTRDVCTGEEASRELDVRRGRKQPPACQSVQKSRHVLQDSVRMRFAWRFTRVGRSVESFSRVDAPQGAAYPRSSLCGDSCVHSTPVARTGDARPAP